MHAVYMFHGEGDSHAINIQPDIGDNNILIFVFITWSIAFKTQV